MVSFSRGRLVGCAEAMKWALICFGLALFAPATAFAEPVKIPFPLTPEEDATLATRYGADYSPQTDAGRKAQASRAADDSGITCKSPTWVATLTCQNELRDKAALANNFPWMDLVRAFDAKVLAAASDADAKRIEEAELLSRVSAAAAAFQQAVAQRVQAGQKASTGQSPARRPAVLLPPSATNCTKIGGAMTCSAD